MRVMIAGMVFCGECGQPMVALRTQDVPGWPATCTNFPMRCTSYRCSNRDIVVDVPMIIADAAPSACTPN